MIRGRIGPDGKPVLAGGGRYANVKKKTVDGIVFDSGHEAERYVELKLMQRAGEISELELQPRIPITIGGIEIRMRSGRFHIKGRHVTYVADFRYQDLNTGERIVEDAKMRSGHRDRYYLLKRALVAAMGIEIQEY